MNPAQQRALKFLFALSCGLVAFAIALGTILVHAVGGRMTPRIPAITATLQVTLTPVANGTDVTLRFEATRKDLPRTLTLEVIASDDGYDDSGHALTGQGLAYSQIRDGAGHPLRITRPDPAKAFHITSVPTDGRQAIVAFHLGLAGNRRVIYPQAYSSQVRVSAITVRTLGPTPSCLDAGGTENGHVHYDTCTINPMGAVQTDDHSIQSIRLELMNR